ncbi:MAG TPA: hypothetical protein VIN40_07990 [Candidatus Tyrphobacter sp.]
MNERVVRALDLAVEGNWQEAAELLGADGDPMATRLRSLLELQQYRVEKQSRALQGVRHEVGNMLTIAQANVEGMLDGVVEPTLERLEGIRDALQGASERLKELIGKD